MTKPRMSDVLLWLADLATGRQEFAHKDKKEVYRELRPMAASLVKAYDVEAFQTDSREAVAATLKWWREADIRERLDTWVSINIQSRHALPPEAEAALVSQEGKHWVALFYRAKDDARQVRALDLIRAHSDEAYGWLLRTEPRAADIAVWKRWDTPRHGDALAAEWSDEDDVRTMARKIALQASTRFGYRDFLMITFARVIRVHAPQHGRAMLDEWNKLVTLEPAPVVALPSRGLFS